MPPFDSPDLLNFSLDTWSWQLLTSLILFNLIGLCPGKDYWCTIFRGFHWRVFQERGCIWIFTSAGFFLRQWFLNTADFTRFSLIFRWWLSFEWNFLFWVLLTLDTAEVLLCAAVWHSCVYGSTRLALHSALLWRQRDWTDPVWILCWLSLRITTLIVDDRGK